MCLFMVVYLQTRQHVFMTGSWYVACTLNIDFSKNSFWCLITVLTGKSCCARSRLDIFCSGGKRPAKELISWNWPASVRWAERDKGIKWWLIFDPNHKWQAKSVFCHSCCQTHLSLKDTQRHREQYCTLKPVSSPADFHSVGGKNTHRRAPLRCWRW